MQFQSKLLKSATTFLDGSWHHADVKGLAADEYTRVNQLISVFGKQVELVRVPSKIEPDSVWTIAYKNHTVKLNSLEDNGVTIVHLRPTSGKKSAQYFYDPDPTSLKILQEAGFEKELLPNEDHFYTKGPWNVAFSVDAEGMDPTGAIWHEDEDEIPFDSPAELKHLIETLMTEDSFEEKR